MMRVKVEDYLKRLTEDSATAAQNAARDAGFEIKDAHAEIAGDYRVVLQVADASSATNEGARHFTRHGFGPPSETT